jgi:hypothetical protein
MYHKAEYWVNTLAMLRLKTDRRGTEDKKED